MSGVCASSTNGTATVTITNYDNDDIDSFIEAFGEIPAELLEGYEEAKKNETVEPLKAHVTSAMAFFDDCNVEESSGTAKLTAIVILSDNSLCLPIFYNGVAISTQRKNTNEWTAATPEGDTVSIMMT